MKWGAGESKPYLREEVEFTNHHALGKEQLFLSNSWPKNRCEKNGGGRPTNQYVVRREAFAFACIHVHFCTHSFAHQFLENFHFSNFCHLLFFCSKNTYSDKNNAVVAKLQPPMPSVPLSSAWFPTPLREVARRRPSSPRRSTADRTRCPRRPCPRFGAAPHL